MLRHYYIADDLNELSEVEQELEAQGFTETQIHVLSDKDADVEHHQLNEVEAVLKKDVVHSTEVGAVVGVAVAACTLLLAYFMGWTESSAGWLPFIFLAVVLLGFCTWEGGFIGIQQPNVNFSKFQSFLAQGKHLLFVDFDFDQQYQLNTVVKAHPNLQDMGIGPAAPGWFIRGQDKFKHFMKIMP